MEAYDFDPKDDILIQLLDLNYEISLNESADEEVQGPGIPKNYKGDISKLISENCVEFDAFIK
jgi:hypothetical protein